MANKAVNAAANEASAQLSRSALDVAWRFGFLGMCGVVLLWHSLRYDFITDDAYISFVYARNLAEHGELVFNPGLPPVEGYTNFLWTALLGVLMMVGLDPEVTSRVLGTGFALGTMVIGFLLTEHLLTRSGSAPGSETGSESRPASPFPYLVPATLALSAGFACWSSGGLETQMFTFWVALALHAYVRGDRGGPWLRRMGLFLALAAMTRPEGLLVTGLIGGHRLAVNLIRERRLMPSRDEWIALAGFLALWAPWYLWRWWYYGHPFPNTYYVKAAGEPPRGYRDELLGNGVYYVWQWARQSGALHVAPILVGGLIVARPRSLRFRFGVLVLALGAIYLLYTIRVGGDFMGLHRFVMPVFFLAAVALSLGLSGLVSLAPAGWLGVRGRTVVGLVLCLAVVAGHGARQIALTEKSLRPDNLASDRGIDTPAFLRVYTADRTTIGRHMRGCFREDDFSIVGGAGAQPYHGRMKGIDVFGLVSERIAHEVRPTRPRAGHNKWGPDRLLLSYEPEFVFSCYSIHRDPRRPRFNCNPGFWRRNGYEQVTVHVPGLRQSGPYYSFFRRADRDFACPGLVE